MRNVRAALVPILLLIAVCALAWFNIDLPFIAEFSFIWDVVLGAVLGIGIALLPALSGFTIRRNAFTSMYWICGFMALLLIFYQYMTMVTGLHADFLEFMTHPGPRMRIVEGVILGYCSLIAGRGKI